MKVLIVNMYYYPNLIGGAEQSVKLLAEGLCNVGEEVHVYTNDGSESSDYLCGENINGVIVHRGYSKSIYRRRICRKKILIDKIINGLHSIVNFKSTKELKKLLGELNPDVLHTNNPVSISYNVWKLCKQKGILVVHTLRDYWLIDPSTVIGKSNNMLCKIHQIYHKYLSNKYVDVVTAPSEFVMKKFISYQYFRNSSKKVIPNGILLSNKILEDIIEKKMLVGSEIIYFMFAGYLSEEKGILLLLKAFSSLNKQNIELVICGDGPLKKYVEDVSRRDYRIIYKGKLSQNELREEYEKNDIIIVPSLWDEPFGRIIIEGAQYGVITIGSDKGGIPEIVNTLKCGKCFDAGDVDMLVSMLSEYVDRNRIKREIHYLKDSLQGYDIKKQIESFRKIYGESRLDI